MDIILARGPCEPCETQWLLLLRVRSVASGEGRIYSTLPIFDHKPIIIIAVHDKIFNSYNE